jgi:phospholipase C
MLRRHTFVTLPLLAGCSLVTGGCSSSSSSPGDAATTVPDAATADGAHADGGATDAGHVDAAGPEASTTDGGSPDASQDAVADAGSDAPAIVHGDGGAASAIQHVVLIVQENHTFDNYFGRYCTAATGSAPTCTTGPACCEAAPATEPGGASPQTLDDSTNGSSNPNHNAACETPEIDQGKMDKYVTGVPICSNAANFAYADSASAATYWTLAGQGALADRYFQPVIGASSSNDMVFARAGFVFQDNTYEPAAKGQGCQGGTSKSYTDRTIADLLLEAGATFGVYAQGYAASVAADPACPAATTGCPIGITTYPCTYDPGDIPFEYYPTLRDDPAHMKDFTQLATDLAAGTLPSFSFVKAIGFLTEHPGAGDTVSGGEAFVQSVVTAVGASSAAASTLILVTWDESGGYFDHVAPPATSTVDNQPYGPRLPLLALGPFAKKNGISHVTMEHSSIVKFLEWNWLGQQTGQLGTRDAVVNNLGSLLDPTTTGVAVPE